jgi:hypothetical protein
VFKNVEYMDGGIASAFKHVDLDHFDPKLFHCKGAKNVVVMQVPIEHKSINTGDVFILDTGKKIFQWNGKTANKYEKAKALEYSTKLRDERGAKAELVILDNDEKNADFWKPFGGTPKAPIGAGVDDEKFAVRDPRLFRVSDASGSMEMTEIADACERGHLLRAKLDSADCFIVDSVAGVFVWVGKGATGDERKKSMTYATEYLKKAGLPNTTAVARVADGGEPQQFKNLFGALVALPAPLVGRRALVR